MKKLKLPPFIAGLVILGLLLGGCAKAPAPTKPEGIELGKLTKTKSIIKGEAEGVAFHYQEESFWSEGSFSQILRILALN